MHPVLRQMRPPATSNDESFHSGQVVQHPAVTIPEGEGIVRLNASSPEKHPRVQFKKETAEAYPTSSNIVRDRPGEEGEEMRDLRLRAGREMMIDRNRVLTDDDFEKDPKTCLSEASAHIQAANLLSAYEQSAKEESNFQRTFNNNVRTLIARQEVTVGLMHLWDFVEAYVGNPNSKTLTAQLFLIVQHSRDEGLLRESLLHIAEPESRWLLDLINILQTIVVQERTLDISAKVAAINYSIITLSKYYARKIYKSIFVPLDKEAKITTFYMRIVVKLLILSDDLGWYRNEKMERVVSGSRRRELNDRELLFCLRRALASRGDEDDLDAKEEFEYGYDLYPVREEEEDEIETEPDAALVLPTHRRHAATESHLRTGGHMAEPTYSGYGLGGRT